VALTYRIIASGTNAFGGTGGFGTSQQQQPAATGSLFGQPQQNTAFGALGTNLRVHIIFMSISNLFMQPTITLLSLRYLANPPNQRHSQPQVLVCLDNPNSRISSKVNSRPLAVGSLEEAVYSGRATNNSKINNSLSSSRVDVCNNFDLSTCQSELTSFKSVFGNTTTTQPASGGLFGGGGLFGNPSNQQQQNQQQPAQNTGFGLFNKPAAPAAPTGGLFGSNPFGQTGTSTTGGQQQTSLFGNTSTNQQPGTGTGGTFSGLFGKPAAPALGQTQSQTGGSSLFGNTGTFNATATAPGAQGTLTASIAQPIGASLPIFNMLPPGPRAVTLDQPKKKPGFFVDVPTRSPVPRLQLGYTPANTKLRGYATEQPASSFSFSSGKPNALMLSRSDGRSPGGPDSFLGRSSSPSLGSGGRQSVKKLILDKKVEPSDLFNKSGSPGLRGSPGKVTFNPQ